MVVDQPQQGGGEERPAADWHGAPIVKDAEPGDSILHLALRNHRPRAFLALVSDDGGSTEEWEWRVTEESSPDFMSQEHTGSDNSRCGSCGGGRTGVGVAVPPVTLRDDNYAWAASPGCTTPANFGLATLHFFCICMRGVMKFLHVRERQIE